jgi:hypothetical protein
MKMIRSVKSRYVTITSGNLTLCTVAAPSTMPVLGSPALRGSRSKPEFKISLRTSSLGESFSTSFEGIPSILAVKESPLVTEFQGCPSLLSPSTLAIKKGVLQNWQCKAI